MGGISILHYSPRNRRQVYWGSASGRLDLNDPPTAVGGIPKFECGKELV